MSSADGPPPPNDENPYGAPPPFGRQDEDKKTDPHAEHGVESQSGETQKAAQGANRFFETTSQFFPQSIHKSFICILKSPRQSRKIKVFWPWNCRKF